jgi:glycosyltransferase involved in cell wall biosynthesis
LRVIHVTTCAAQGGIEQWLQSLIKFADPARLKFVRCVVTGDCVDPQVAKSYRVPLEFGGKESVLRACRDCDVLLVSDPAGLGPIVAEIDPPVCVMVAHGDGHWTRSRLAWMQPAIDHVIAVSELVKQIVCEGFPTTVIHNGVDAARLAASMGRNAARAKFGFHADDFVLGWCGRFSEEKKPLEIIEAVARMPANFKALLVGFGYLRPEVMDLANELIPGRYAVVCRHDYLGDVYQAMDAFSLTSFSEGFGLVLLEAMLHRLPIISTPVGLVHDVVVDRVNGLVVDGEPDSIRDAAIQLQSRPDWCAAIGAEGFRWADAHGHAAKMAQAYADLLWSLWNARAVKAS